MPTATLSPPTARGSDFAALSGLVARAGLLRPRPGYYVARIGLVASLYLAGWVAFVLIGNSWYQLILAPCLAVVFAQLALVSHDIAHRQVFRTRRVSEIAGLVAGNIGIGMSYGWWMDKHTRHHANPNHEERDPDVAPDALVWSTRQADAARGMARLLGAWQAYLFFPLLTLEALSLCVSSVRALRSRPSMRYRRTEAALLLLHFIGYLGIVLLCCRRPGPPSSSPFTSGCSACTSAARSRPTTRACRCSRTPTSARTSCAARCSPHATFAADLSSMYCSAG